MQTADTSNVGNSPSIYCPQREIPLGSKEESSANPKTTRYTFPEDLMDKLGFGLIVLSDWEYNGERSNLFWLMEIFSHLSGNHMKRILGDFSADEFKDRSQKTI
jgi:hypothetical protein